MSIFFEERTEQDQGKEFLVLTQKKSAKLLSALTAILGLILVIYIFPWRANEFDIPVSIVKLFIAVIVICIVPSVLIGIDTRGKYWSFISSYTMLFKNKEVRIKGKPYGSSKPMELWLEK